MIGPLARSLSGRGAWPSLRLRNARRHDVPHRESGLHFGIQQVLNADLHHPQPGLAVLQHKDGVRSAVRLVQRLDGTSTAFSARAPITSTAAVVPSGRFRLVASSPTSSTYARTTEELFCVYRPGSTWVTVPLKAWSSRISKVISTSASALTLAQSDSSR